MQMNQKVCSWMIAAGLLAQVAGAQTNPPAAAPAGLTPKIQFDKTVYDFGSTSPVTQVAGKFIISNTGSATLEIKKPQPSCGCTVAALTKDKLEPGEKAELGFTVNVGVPRGHVEKHITVPSNDPSQPSVNLTLKVDIIPTFDVTPQSISLGNIHQSVTTNITVQIKRLDGRPLGLARAEANNKNIIAKLGAPQGSNDLVMLTVAINAGGSPGPLNDSIRVLGSDTNTPPITIAINGRIVGDVTANPETQFWGIVDPDNWPGGHPEQTVRKFTLTSNVATANFDIKRVSTDLGDVSVAFAPVVPGKTYEITATLSKAPKQSLRGTIKVETTLASQPTVELGLTINVLKRN
jgi:hypothetical protein